MNETEETDDIGIWIADDDFEFFRRATVGKEHRVKTAIAMYSIMEGSKLGKQRQIHKQYQIYKKGNPIVALFDGVNKNIGTKSMKAVNLMAALEIRNGSGSIDQILKDIERDFDNWLKLNGGKIEV